jgi:DNA-directed RNA polymerase specialized sigma24 family protein
MKRLMIKTFTVPELDKFRKLCNFTPDERLYFELRAQGKSNIEVAMTMNCSEAQVSKLSNRAKTKMKRIMYQESTENINQM